MIEFLQKRFYLANINIINDITWVTMSQHYEPFNSEYVYKINGTIYEDFGDSELQYQIELYKTWRNLSK